MASAVGQAPVHRSVTSLRAPPQGQTGSGTNAPRNAHATYGSPSTIRTDDDFLIIEIGSRFMRVGFAGDNVPKAVLTFGPECERRTGDFSHWQPRDGPEAEVWAESYEIWQCNLREAELGLIQDRLDRLLRDALMRCLLIDSRPRRAGLVLDSAVPIPLLSIVLDLLFKSFQAPMVSLLSAATMSAVAAGIRSALVIDMGWRETVVTSVYEYREVRCTRTVRGGKLLHQQVYKLLRKTLTGEDGDDEGSNRVMSFAECEDVMHRLMWCRPSAKTAQRQPQTQLDTVVEQDETEADASRPTTRVPLTSTRPPRTIDVALDDVADVCDDAFFDTAVAPTTFDDHEVPVHLLVYQHLVQLPVDVRAVCMARLVFTGGCSNILGIRERIVDEVTAMVGRRGWANVSGKGVETRNSHLSDRRASPKPSTSPASDGTDPHGTEDASKKLDDSITPAQTDADPIEAKVVRHRPRPQLVQGHFRTLHSLGPWAGASLLCQLKVPAMATIDRELWLQQGVGGASRPNEVDLKAQQRQSIGTGGFIRGSGGHHTNWTLGAWGYL